MKLGVPWWPSVTAVAQIPSPTWELLHAAGAGKKKKKKVTLTTTNEVLFPKGEACVRLKI